MEADLREEIAALDGGQDFNLPGRGQGGKFIRAGEELPRFRLKVLESLDVDRLPRFVKCRQGAIDEIDYVGFAGAGRVIAGNNLRGHAFDFGRLLGRKEFQLRRLARLRRVVRVLLRGHDSRPARRQPCRGRSGEE